MVLDNSGMSIDKKALIYRALGMVLDVGGSVFGRDGRI
jgi:hypothetical protein